MYLSFYNDLNIHYIYQEIIDLLNGYIMNKIDYENECKRLRHIIHHTHNPSDKLKASTLLRDREHLLPMIKNDTLIQSYRDKAYPYICEYITLCGTSRVFGMDKCNNIPKRVGIIYLFLQVSRQFIDIVWECTYDMSMICPCCYYRMRKFGPIMVCDNCKHSHPITKTLSVYLDINDIKVESTYDAPKNFKKEYMHLCGIINDMRDCELEDICSYLYRAAFKNPTRENIRDGIKACGYSNYHDINYIYSEVTREPLPSILEYLDICTVRFEKYFKIFHSVSDKEGKNVTGIHFLIKLFLWQENIPYNDEWFRSLSIPTEMKHRKNALKVCKLLSIQDKNTNWNTPISWEDK